MKCVIALLVGFYLSALGSVSTLNTFKHNIKDETLTPLVFVPGFMGSQLYASNTDITVNGTKCAPNTSKNIIWIDVDEIAKFLCFRYKMSLKYDTKTNSMVTPEEVDIKPGKFGSTASVATLGKLPGDLMVYFNDLFKKLETIGYVRDYNIKGAPYDFRRVPLDPAYAIFEKNLINLIDQQYHLHNRTKVGVVTHSFGGPLFRKVVANLPKEFKQTRIKFWMNVNGAVAGSTKAVHAITTGNVGYDWLPVKGKDFISSILSTYTAAYYLQPSKSIFGLDRVYIRNESHVWTGRNISQLQSLTTKGMSDNVYKAMDDDIFTWDSPGVDFICVHSQGVNTVDVLSLDRNYQVNMMYNSYVDGDGTLTLPELEACKKIAKLNTGHKNTVRVIKGQSHTGILKGEEIFQILKEFIY